MDELVEIYFKYDRKGYFLNSDKIKLHSGQYVIVEADKGADIGRVARYYTENGTLKNDIKKIIRVANKEDMERLVRIHKLENDAKEKFRDALKKQPFNMQLIDVEYQFDGNRLTFYFMAGTRLDFRNFLKDLAKIFHTRIELRQINERQEIERLGGIGPCGRELCCKNLHLNFEKVTPQMIKDQNITTGISKVTGLCGKLLCCLAYEENFYRERAKEFPPLNNEILYHDKKVRVTKNNYLASTVELKDEEGIGVTILLSEYKSIEEGEGRNAKKYLRYSKEKVKNEKYK